MHISDRIARTCTKITSIKNYKTHPDLYEEVVKACNKYRVSNISHIFKLLDIDFKRNSNGLGDIREEQRKRAKLIKSN
jgi:hypothetical protein